MSFFCFFCFCINHISNACREADNHRHIFFLEHCRSSRGGVMVKLALEGLDVVDGLQDDLELGQLLRLLSPLLGQQEPQLLHIHRTQLLGPPDVLQLSKVHGLLHHRHRCCCGCCCGSGGAVASGCCFCRSWLTTDERKLITNPFIRVELRSLREHSAPEGVWLPGSRCRVVLASGLEQVGCDFNNGQLHAQLD